MADLTIEDCEIVLRMRMIDLVAVRKQREELRLKHAEELCLNAALMNRPSLVMEPVVLRENGKWKAAKGDIIGYGDTPSAAMDNFDEVYTNGY